MKDQLTPAGIEPLTFRIVAQHLNHCATACCLVDSTIFSAQNIVSNHNHHHNHHHHQHPTLSSPVDMAQSHTSTSVFSGLPFSVSSTGWPVIFSILCNLLYVATTFPVLLYFVQIST